MTHEECGTGFYLSTPCQYSQSKKEAFPSVCHSSDTGYHLTIGEVCPKQGNSDTKRRRTEKSMDFSGSNPRKVHHLSPYPEKLSSIFINTSKKSLRNREIKEVIPNYINSRLLF